jgi:hypothetical protein
MARLEVTFRGEAPTVFTGPRQKILELAERIRDAMTLTVDTIITHDLETEPRSFLCSEIVNLHPVED